MNLIKINLNQTISKAQIDSLKEEKNRWAIFGSICGLFIITIIWFVIINTRLNSVINQRETTISNIEQETRKLKNKGKINLSKKEINNLYNIETKRVLWSKKLIALSQITPEDMSVTKLEFSKNKLSISAVSSMNEGTKEFTVVEDFMNRIEQNEEFNKDFRNIKFDNLDKEQTRFDELLSFKVEAKLKK
tara:strand:+ start:1280 stop:1849 length:570 start_codon:yes stop_codon:yes gene_type:complete